MSSEESVYDFCLVRRFQSGDESAFTEIFNRYHKRLCVFVSNYVKNRSDVDEVVSKALAQAYRHLNSFRGDSSLSTWLHSIARNLAINFFHSARRRNDQLSISIDARIGEEKTTCLGEMLVSEGLNPFEQVTLSELSKIIEECIPRLRQNHQFVLRLLYEEHYLYRDISEELSIPVATVKTRITRARTALREMVNQILISSRG